MLFTFWPTIWDMGDIGCYGQQKIKTPNLDKMRGKECGLLSIMPAVRSVPPCRCSLMTGFAYRTLQIRGNKEIAPEGQQPMEADTYTLGKLMKSAGYANRYLRRQMGLGYPGSSSVPSTMGFDEFFGYNCQSVRLILVYPDHLWHNNDTVFLSENDNNGRKVYSQDLIHEQALKFYS